VLIRPAPHPRVHSAKPRMRAVSRLLLLEMTHEHGCGLPLGSQGLSGALAPSQVPQRCRSGSNELCVDQLVAHHIAAVATNAIALVIVDHF
jgi:hypothetical protein